MRVPGLEPGMLESHGFTARCDTNSAHTPLMGNERVERSEPNGI